MSRRHKAMALAVLAVTFAVVLSAGAASSARGERALVASDQALAQGDMLGAVLAAREAAEAAAPFGGLARRAYEKLDALARDAEGHGDLTTARAARRAARTAARETDSASPFAGGDTAPSAVVPRWLFAVVTLVGAASALAVTRFVALRRS